MTIIQYFHLFREESDGIQCCMICSGLEGPGQHPWSPRNPGSVYHVNVTLMSEPIFPRLTHGGWEISNHSVRCESICLKTTFSTILMRAGTMFTGRHPSIFVISFGGFGMGITLMSFRLV